MCLNSFNTKPYYLFDYQLFILIFCTLVPVCSLICVFAYRFPVGWHYQNRGSYRQGEKYRRKSLALAEDSFEPGHPDIATSQSNLAVVLQGLGELEEARELLRKALAADENSFEPGHPTIAIRQSNLALVLQDLGELEEARDLLRRAYNTFLEKFGPNHPHTKTVKENHESI